MKLTRLIQASVTEEEHKALVLYAQKSHISHAKIIRLALQWYLRQANNMENEMPTSSYF